MGHLWAIGWTALGYELWQFFTIVTRQNNVYNLYVMYDFQVIETLARLHIVMEYASGGELYTKVSNEGKLSEPDARLIYSQILAALDHMVCMCLILQLFLR